MMNMMVTEKTNSQLLFLLSISSLLFLSFPGSTNCDVQTAAPPTAVDPAIDQMCGRTAYYYACIAALIPFPPQMNITATAMLEVALNETLKLTEAVLTEATLLTQTAFNDDWDTSMQSCQQFYTSAVEDLKKAVQAVADGDGRLFCSSVKAAMKGYSDCEDANTIQDTSEGTLILNPNPVYIDNSPFKQIYTRLNEMAYNCMDISTAIHWYCS